MTTQTSSMTIVPRACISHAVTRTAVRNDVHVVPVGRLQQRALGHNVRTAGAVGTAAGVLETSTLVLPTPKLSILLLVFTVLISALSVIYVKDYNRRLFVDYQHLQRESASLQAIEGKLLREQGMVASHTFVQEVAERDLNMQVPMAKSIVVIKA